MQDEFLTRFWKPFVFAVLVLIAGGTAVGIWLHSREQPKELRLPGTVETQEVRLSSRVGGRVTKVLVNESDLVEPGQKIVELEMPELDAQRGQLVAQKEAAEAILARLQNGARAEEKAAAKAAMETAAAKLQLMQHGYRKEEVEQSRQDLQAFDADFQNAQQELSRERALLARGATTTQAYDAANAKYNKLLAQVSSAGAKLKMMESGYRVEEIAESKADLERLRANYDLLLAGTRQEEIDEAKARVSDLAAKIDEIDVRRNERTVIAPERAVVETLMVRPGDIAAPNQAVALVLRADDLWVKAYISEIDLGKIRLGEPVMVTSDAYPGKRFEGTITYIASASEFTPRNVQTIDERRHQVFGFKVRVKNPGGVFKSGMAADVWLPSDVAP
jgi:multidrug resistance efflux pump